MGASVIPPRRDVATAVAGPKGIRVPGPVFDPNAPVSEDMQSASATNPTGIPSMDGVPLPEPKPVTPEEIDAALQKAAPETRPETAADKALATNPQANGPVNVPGWSPSLSLREVDMPDNGTCQSVRPGDRVHFTLRVENAQAARHVLTHLQLALNSHAHFRTADLALERRDTMGGGGIGLRDSDDRQLYHFSFVVPFVDTGIYRTTGIDVLAAFGDSIATTGVGIPLDHHSRAQVKAYCLAVFNGYGGERPVVTEFLPDPVEHAAIPQPRPLFSSPE